MIERDAQLLAARFRADFPTAVGVPDRPWLATAAARVIDCVLSLRKSYVKVVVPRVRAFAEAHPTVRTCHDLRAMIATHSSPAEFHTQVLRMNSGRKATALVGVLEYLIDIQQRFNGATEDERLRTWAQWARPGDYLTLDVDGFKLAGFQYLRILFGAQTVKPDAHIIRYVESALGRPIAGRASREVQAVYAVERAGEIIGRPVRELDIAMWERGSGHRLPS